MSTIGTRPSNNWTVGHKEVKNVIHNEMGITKEQIMEVFAKIARDEVKELIGQNGEFIRGAIREIIQQEMMWAVQEGKYPGVKRHMWSYPEKDEFKQFVANILKEEAIEMFRQQFDIGIKVNLKEDRPVETEEAPRATDPCWSR